MTKLKKVLLLAFIFVLAFSTFAFATEGIEVTSDQINPISEDAQQTSLPEITYQDVYRFDDNMVFDELVDGNAFLAGSKIVVSGEVNGNLFVFGDEVTIEENSCIYNSLFVIANKLTLNGVCYDLYGMSDTFVMGENSYIYRDLNLSANEIFINGYVNRNANISANTIILDYPDGPAIRGNLNYTSPTQLTFEDNTVVGEIQFTQKVAKASTETTIYNIITKFIFFFVIFLLASWLAPVFSKRSGEIATSLNLLHALWIGIVATIAFFIISAILYAYIPMLATIILLIYVTGMLLATPVFALALTHGIAKNKNFALKILLNLVITVAMIALPFIPFVGLFFSFIFYVLGFGILVFYLFDGKRRGRTKKEKTVEGKNPEPKKVEVKEEPKKVDQNPEVKKEENKKTSSKKETVKQSKEEKKTVEKETSDTSKDETQKDDK